MKKKIILLISVTIAGLTSLNAQWIGNNIIVSGQNVSNLRSMYFINKDTGWVVGDAILNSQILKTADGGNNWVSQNSNSFENLDNVFFINENIGFSTGDGGPFLKTNDGGNNWTSVPITGSNFSPSYLSNFYFVNEQVGFYTTTYTIFKTINSGVLWTPVLENSEAPITNISFNNDGNNGIAVCFSGKAYKTTNSGETWQLIPQFTGSYFYDVSNTFNEIYIAGDLAFFKSSDFGETWSIVPFPLATPGNGYISVSFPSINIGFCGGSPYEVYKTIDGGNTWENQTSLQEVYSPKIQMINDTIGYILADPSSGKFYKTTNGGNSDISTAPSDISTNFKVKVYPNPASTHFTLDYGNYQSMKGYTLRIINTLGQTIYNTSIVQQTYSIDLSNWKGNGIYFVQLIDSENNTIDNKKIVIF